jgi:pimeloyl-ACP methyl ester carboxylesterase
MTTQKQMFEQYMSYDANALGTRFEVPFFIFQGASDVLTITKLAEEYFDTVDAPSKEFAHIEGASHFAAFTQPERFLTELVTRVHPLAEKRPASIEAAGPGATRGGQHAPNGR